jgi:hypothetical protein
MTESWEKELARLREKKKKDKKAQAEAQKIESELPEIQDGSNVAIMIPSRRRKKKGDGES